ncbi:MAG TPA: FAD-dependent oxidoreductase [Kofleriaceae bacterium]|nr:FAD-dependent oxidoreductase [Kofleriaceae bacterium]
MLRPSRRDVLQVLLGLPAAAAACRASAAAPLPDGALAGGAEVLGHALRDHPPPAPPRDRALRAEVVVVGAGVAGLAAAWRLARAGVRVQVLELDAAPGGTAQGGRSPVTPYPWGAHYIVAPLADHRALVRLLGEMDALEGTGADGHPVVREELRCREPEERIFHQGRWYEGLYLHAGASRADRADLAAFERAIDGWVAWRDGRGRRAFALPLARASDDAEVTALDRMTMTEWLDRERLHSPRLRWLVDYACRDDYGMRAADTSAWAALFYFAARRRAPGADSQPVVTWPEGNGRLVAHLARAAGAIDLGAAVCDLAADEGGVDVLVRRRGGAVTLLRADHVVFAGPQMVARRVLRAWRDHPPPHVAEFEYAPWMVANLHLAGRPAGRPDDFPLAWDNVIHDSPGLGYVVATHQSGRDHGDTVLTYYRPLADGDPRQARHHLMAADRDDWAEVVLADLGRAHPDLRRRTRRLDVMRWGHGMIRPRPGFVWGAARRAAARPVGRIHFAHSDLSGVALFEEALDQGVRAAEEVLAARGDRVESWR